MLRILVVDDCFQMTVFLKMLLTWRGYDVTMANGGSEGKQCFDNTEFDLVISDICMPKFDGNALARHIKTSARPVPVLALTGSSEMACAAFDQILSKPIQSKILLAAIKRISISKEHRQVSTSSLEEERQPCLLDSMTAHESVSQADGLS